MNNSSILLVSIVFSMLPPILIMLGVKGIQKGLTVTNPDFKPPEKSPLKNWSRNLQIGYGILQIALGTLNFGAGSIGGIVVILKWLSIFSEIQ